ncbi:MAG TPA: hypothetical protein VNQ77_08470 [Frankiaceae bacterium]|nr:hypothetical protein [Frankiaceae bacterium]
MTEAPRDAWAAPPLADERASRAGCALALVGLFLLGFVAVGAVLLLRAPDGGSSLGDDIRPPAGYVRLDDAESGGGTLSEARTADVLRTGDDVPGFEDAELRAWGRRPGEPVRAVVVLAVQLGSPADAVALRVAYVDAVLDRGATPFAPPQGLDAGAFFEPPDSAGRHAQRVAFARGSRMFVVSVVTPERDPDTAEVVRLALDQAAAVETD